MIMMMYVTCMAVMMIIFDLCDSIGDVVNRKIIEIVCLFVCV